MGRTEIILAQSQDSPYKQLLETTLGSTYPASVLRLSSLSDLPQLAASEPALVIWDICGFSDLEIQSLGKLLALSQAGVMLVCAQISPEVSELLSQVQALALLVAPQGAPQVAATLDVALATHRRLLTLGNEMEQLKRHLADRLVVERAKRVLMAAKGMSESQAMASLQNFSRQTNQKLVAVARQVLAAHQIFNGVDAEGGEEGQ